MKLQPVDVALSSDELRTLVLLRHRGALISKPGRPIEPNPQKTRKRMKVLEGLIAKGLVTATQRGAAIFYEAVEATSKLPTPKKTD